MRIQGRNHRRQRSKRRRRAGRCAWRGLDSSLQLRGRNTVVAQKPASPGPSRRRGERHATQPDGPSLPSRSCIRDTRVGPVPGRSVSRVGAPHLLHLTGCNPALSETVESGPGDQHLLTSQIAHSASALASAAAAASAAAVQAAAAAEGLEAEAPAATSAEPASVEIHGPASLPSPQRPYLVTPA